MPGRDSSSPADRRKNPARGKKGDRRKPSLPDNPAKPAAPAKGPGKP